MGQCNYFHPAPSDTRVSRSMPYSGRMYQTQLREREVLLVLDNLEHLVTAAPLISAILAAAPGVRVLATSRALLRLAGEHIYLVPPLSVVDDSAATPAPAVELFLIHRR